jgi:transcriptional regulator with XRE-family HTH domain
VREQVAAELPVLVARLPQLKAAREKRGLSLADLTKRTGMDRSAISKLESGQRPNPTLDTLVRYAEAVGKRLVVQLADE